MKSQSVIKNALNTANMDSAKSSVASKIDPWWAFIRSTRFWVMILGSLAVYAETKGWIGEPERNLIATISTVFITVKTLDRGAERIGK